MIGGESREQVETHKQGEMELRGGEKGKESQLERKRER